ncbi:tigger transposable element-derived protein 6-like [Rhizophagus irregularis DAOM 181602=DAOM 197198]|nr:tigger transposable element-derived protein 6-like [Rhizophagus irregularis DAOM 181602=DAOM 197198]
MRENKDTNNKKKKSLTLAQKKELCKKQRDQKLSGVQLAAQYGISTSTCLSTTRRTVECANLLDITNFSASAGWELKKDLSLFDNARCHESENINSLSNVKVHFLPPNTTSFLQPLDQGIIYSLKAQYRKLLCQNRIQAYVFYEEGDPIPPPIDIFDSINLIADAWKKVSKKTILNSWAKAGILPNNNMEDSEYPLAVNDYINIDNRASAEEELSLQEIVDVVKGTNEREIEEEEEQDEISTIVALNSIENVIKYIQQKDLEIGNLEMKNLIKLKKKDLF